MAANITKITGTIQLSFGDGEGCAIGTVEVPVIARMGDAKVHGGELSLDTPDLKPELAKALREIADGLDGRGELTVAR